MVLSSYHTKRILEKRDVRWWRGISTPHFKGIPFFCLMKQLRQLKMGFLLRLVLELNAQPQNIPGFC